MMAFASTSAVRPLLAAYRRRTGSSAGCVRSGCAVGCGKDAVAPRAAYMHCACGWHALPGQPGYGLRLCRVRRVVLPFWLRRPRRLRRLGAVPLSSLVECGVPALGVQTAYNPGRSWSASSVPGSVRSGSRVAVPVAAVLALQLAPLRLCAVAFRSLHVVRHVRGRCQLMRGHFTVGACTRPARQAVLRGFRMRSPLCRGVCSVTSLCVHAVCGGNAAGMRRAPAAYAAGTVPRFNLHGPYGHAEYGWDAACMRRGVSARARW